MTTLEPPDHGVYRCFSGARIPKDLRTSGQPCPFCGRTLSLTPTAKDETSRRVSLGLVVGVILVFVFLVIPVVIAGALFLGEEISAKFSEVEDTPRSTEALSADELLVAYIEDAGGEITAEELAALKARVVLIDGLNTCDEFFEYMSTEVPIEEAGLLGLAVGAYSDGTAERFFRECTDQLAISGEASQYGDDVILDRMWDGCASGIFEYCDLLVIAPLGSAYEAFGASCGDRLPGTADWCLIALGDGIDLTDWRSRCGADDYACL